jgi:hypothetical protein
MNVLTPEVADGSGDETAEIEHCPDHCGADDVSAVEQPKDVADPGTATPFLPTAVPQWKPAGTDRPSNRPRRRQAMNLNVACGTIRSS